MFEAKILLNEISLSLKNKARKEIKMKKELYSSPICKACMQMILIN